MQRIPQLKRSGPIGGKTGLKARLWPNGECQIWKPKTFAARPIEAYDAERDEPVILALWRMLGNPLSWVLDEHARLGLSPLPIFDKPLERDVVESQRDEKVRARKGTTGISGYGKRLVRNACDVLQREAGKARCIFATVTVPNVPLEKLSKIHNRWSKVVELYRLNVKRALEDKGLSGELVTVSEIQEKRHKNTGLPVLHLHSVFVGVTKVGKFAISTEQHDDMWYRALNVVVDIDRAECATACNLQRVRKDAGAYLGKYMSKGAQSVRRALDDGLASWLPKHWWNCTRSLGRRVKSQTRRIDFLAEWLNDVAEESGFDIWEWHRNVSVEMKDGHEIIVAKYGRLNRVITEQIMQSL